MHGGPSPEGRRRGQRTQGLSCRRLPACVACRDSGAATVTVIHRTSYRELFQDSVNHEVRCAALCCAGGGVQPQEEQAQRLEKVGCGATDKGAML